MRESKEVTSGVLKSFATLNETALDAIPARIEFVFSVLRVKGKACIKSMFISSLAT